MWQRQGDKQPDEQLMKWLKTEGAKDWSGKQKTWIRFYFLKTK